MRRARIRRVQSMSLSSLLMLLASGVAIVTVALSVWIFTSLYNDVLRKNAATSSSQSVAQAVNAIRDYTSDTTRVLRRISDELDAGQNEILLTETLETMVQMRDDLVSIAVYHPDGRLLDSWAPGRSRKARAGTFSIGGGTTDRAGSYITPPHVQNIYNDYYPWVITVARLVALDRYDSSVYVTMDLQFSTIARYLDDVGIGQRGYCFLIDQQGRLVYHPQQQLIYAGLKTEDTAALARVSDGVHIEKDRIQVLQSVPGSGWRLVGVSYLNELVGESRRAALQQVCIVIACALVILLAVALLLSRVVSRPIHRLVDQMHAFAQDAPTFSYQPVSGTQEIVLLSDSFEHMVGHIQQLMEEVRRNEEILRKAELKALQAQINPHFLYNTLDSIQWMCEMGRTQDAVQMVGALARLFRISISRGADLIPLARELEHAESYLIIQKFRYKDQFSYRFVVDDSVTDCMCSKITLQPIIENAILHGFGEFVDDGEIVITARADGADVVLTVQDNGIGMDEETCRAILSRDADSPAGIGIRNVADRIRIYFGPTAGLTIESEPDQGTCVTIRLPQDREGTI